MSAYGASIKHLRDDLEAHSKENKTANHSKTLLKLEYNAFKYKLLVIVSGISTIVWLITYVIFQLAISASIDFIVSCITLTLFSRFPVSKMLYEKYLCCLCINYCDPSGYAKYDEKDLADNMEDKEKQELIESTQDTYDIVQKVATIMEGKRNNSGTDVQLETQPADES